MVIAQLGHINARACQLWLAPDASVAQRERYASVVGEFTTRPLTLAVIEELLDAVAR